MNVWSRSFLERCCATDEIIADGENVVEISLKEGAVFDRVSGEDLRKIASSLVQLCVIASHEGGAAFKMGWYWCCPIWSVPLILNVFRGARTYDLVGPRVYAECGVL